MDNNIDGALTTTAQYKKLTRAINIVLRVDLGLDEYYAIMQLMNDLPTTAALVLDETHEDI